ncbi:phage tail protein [Erwinia rhapontici]|uniref:phage tail protein n=1 Tax=Erwinia rhapontici TaxID=55212 RepID=UPI003BA38B32
MMMILGMMVFERRTLPYQTMKQTSDYRWASGSRIGTRQSQQFLGVGDETITLSGELRPEITGGVASLFALNIMATQGRAWPLLSGNGIPYGMFVITSVNGTHSDLLQNGTARKISFDITLKRVDPSLLEMFGDLKQQAEEVINQVGKKASQLIGSL